MSALDFSHYNMAYATEPLSSKLREGLLIVLVALTLNLVGNGSRGLWDRDEPRYAGCTREMVARNDLIFPTFNAEPRYHKPVLIYWLMMIGMKVGGDNPFGARLVPALAGVGTCLLVWALGRRMFSRRAGLMAALMMATAPIVVANAKMATTDAVLLFFFVGCQFALWELSRRPSRLAAAAFWGSLVGATLTKGPIGPVMLVQAAIVSWWWGGPTIAWRRLRWTWGVPLSALVTLPWFIAIGILSRGEFFQVSMGYHVIRRMTTSIETHGGFPGYYVVLSLLTFYPWSALLPAALLAAWVKRRSNPTFGFLLGWVVGPLIFLEIVRTKLIHYYLPAYPACALLAAWLVEAVAASEVNLRRWPLGRVSLALLTGIGIASTVGLLAGALVLPWDLRWPCLIMALVMGPGTLYAMERFQAGATVRASWSLVGTWAAVLLLMGAWLLPRIDPYRVTPKVAHRLAALSESEKATPVLVGFKAPGVVYELGHPAPIVGSREELAERVGKDGAVVAALSEAEITHLKADPRWRLDVRDTVNGNRHREPLAGRPPTHGGHPAKDGGPGPASPEGGRTVGEAGRSSSRAGTGARTADAPRRRADRARRDRPPGGGSPISGPRCREAGAGRPSRR